MIDIPSALNMRAKANHAAEVIKANEKWFEATIGVVNESAENGYTTTDIPWPSNFTSYDDKKILVKQFQDAGYYIDETRDSIANYCRITW